MSSSNDLPVSDPTKALIVIKNSLRNVDELVRNAHDPISELATNIVELGKFAERAVDTLNKADDILKGMNNAIWSVEQLSRLIPEVGPIISQVVRAIRATKIFNFGEKIIANARRVVRNAKEKTIKQITDASEALLREVETLSSNLPGWTGTADTLEKISHVIDFLVLVLFKGMVPLNLNNPFSGIVDHIRPIEETLNKIKTFVKDVWNKFRENILAAIKNGLGPIVDALQSMSDKLKRFTEPLDSFKKIFDETIGKFLKPILDLFNWVFDNTIGKVIEIVLQTTSLREKIDDLAKELSNDIGLDKLENKISNAVGQPLDDIAKSLADFADVEKIKAIQGNITSVVQEIEKYRGDRVDVLFLAIQNITSYKPETGPFVIPEASGSTASGTDSSPEAAGGTSGSNEPGHPDVDVVMKSQEQIDAFVRDAWAGQTSIPKQTVSSLEVSSNKTQTNAPLKLGYSFYNGVPVSILMRVQHQEVLDLLNSFQIKQVEAPSKVLSSRDIAVPEASGAAASESNSTAAFPQFDVYLSKYEMLMTEVATATSHLENMKGAAGMMDTMVANYQGGAVEFFDHFLGLLNGLDPILAASQSLLQLPTKYETALTQGLRNVFQNAGISEAPLGFMPYIFQVITKTMDMIAKFKALKEAVASQCQETHKNYAVLHDHMAGVFNPDQFGKAIGPDVSNLSSLLVALQKRLKQLTSCFMFFKSLHEAIFQDQHKLSGDIQAYLHQLDPVYAKFVPIIEKSIATVKSLTAQTDKLFEQFRALQSDLGRASGIAQTISDQCRAVETKLIAAENVKKLCLRIEASIGPFEGLLTKLNVSSDASAIVSSGTTGSPAQVSDLFEQTFGLLSNEVCRYLETLLDRYFDLSDIKAKMVGIDQELKTAATSDLAALADGLQQLGKLCHIGNPLPLPPTTPGSTLGPVLLFKSPFIDEVACNAISAEITKTIQGIKFTPDTAVAELLKVPTTGAASDNGTAVKLVYLLSWMETWDAAEPRYPSRVFVTWFSLLECFENVMQHRSAWQRKDKDSSVKQAPPNNLSPSALAFWNLLEEKAIPLNNKYYSAIGNTLQAPLHARIDQLLNGTLQLDSANDLLKQLPDVPTKDLLPAYVLSQEALKLLSDSFQDKKIPDALTQVINQQNLFEPAAADARPLLAAITGIASAPTVATDGPKVLDELHDDLNLMIARKFLELTGDEKKAEQFIKLAGSETALKK